MGEPINLSSESIEQVDQSVGSSGRVSDTVRTIERPPGVARHADGMVGAGRPVAAPGQVGGFGEHTTGWQTP
jgi:hypothetical protein